MPCDASHCEPYELEKEVSRAADKAKEDAIKGNGI